jgi:hypothetical protein
VFYKYRSGLYYRNLPLARDIPGQLRTFRAHEDSRAAGTELGNYHVVVVTSRLQCAVKRRWSTARRETRPGTGSLHPVAIGAAVEVTKPPEPPM